MEINVFYAFAGILYIGYLVWVLAQIKRNNDQAHTHSIEIYSKGQRTYPAFFIGIVMAITMVGPADALGLSEKGFFYGTIWAVFPTGAAIAQFISGRFFTGPIHENFSKLVSVGDIFKEKCGRTSAIIVGLVAFVQSIAFSGVLILAGGKILDTFLGVPMYIGVSMTALFVGGYTAINGMEAVMRTDKVQAVSSGVIFLVIFIAAIYLVFSSAPLSDDAQIMKKDAFSADHDWPMIWYLFLGYFLGEMLLPAYIVRAKIANSSDDASKGFMIASLLLIFWYVVITTAGSLFPIVFPNVDSPMGSDILLAIIRSATQEGSLWYKLLGALTFLAFLGLIHSTFDSFLNVGAVSFSRDVIGNLFGIGDKDQKWLAQRATLGIAAIGLLLAIWVNDLIEILFIGYTIWVPSLLAPMLRIVLNPHKKLGQRSFLIGISLGSVSFGLFNWLIITPVPAILIGFVFNGAAILICEKVYDDA